MDHCIAEASGSTPCIYQSRSCWSAFLVQAYGPNSPNPFKYVQHAYTIRGYRTTHVHFHLMLIILLTMLCIYSGQSKPQPTLTCTLCIRCVTTQVPQTALSHFAQMDRVLFFPHCLHLTLVLYSPPCKGCPFLASRQWQLDVDSTSEAMLSLSTTLLPSDSHSELDPIAHQMAVPATISQLHSSPDKLNPDCTIPEEYTGSQLWTYRNCKQLLIPLGKV